MPVDYDDDDRLQVGWAPTVLDLSKRPKKNTMIFCPRCRWEIIIKHPNPIVYECCSCEYAWYPSTGQPCLQPGLDGLPRNGLSFMVECALCHETFTEDEGHACPKTNRRAAVEATRKKHA